MFHPLGEVGGMKALREDVALKDCSPLKEDLKALFQSQSLAVLATQSHGYPYASLVAFVATEDLKYLLFATGRATRKYANISADSRVAMLIDNRSNQVADFRLAMAVTARGTAEEFQGTEKETLLEAYLAKHPHLREFVKAPSCAFLRISVETYFVVNRFQHVVELHVKT